MCVPVSVEDVRALLAVVPQQVHLFNATVRDNLLLANPDATDEQIVAACTHGADSTTSSRAGRRATTRWWGRTACC